MASPSKEENVLKLILENSPLKEWHFDEIVKQAEITKAAANKWLKKYVKEGVLNKIKQKGKFPFFIAGKDNPNYQSLKKIYALEKIHESGLISKLMSLKKTKTIILFGSMIKGDWYKNSDLDIFILGNYENFGKKIFEQKLKRQIEIHQFQNKKEIQGTKTGLIKNIINGYIIKGRVQDIIEVV